MQRDLLRGAAALIRFGLKDMDIPSPAVRERVFPCAAVGNVDDDDGSGASASDIDDDDCFGDNNDILPPPAPNLPNAPSAIEANSSNHFSQANIGYAYK